MAGERCLFRSIHLLQYSVKEVIVRRPEAMAMSNGHPPSQLVRTGRR